MEEKKVKISWIKNGNDYQRVEGECDNVDTIPPGIYTVHVSDKRGWWLEFYREKFTFDYKLYGCDEGFIDYFMRTYDNTKGNIGVMFNGIKGTGKTVTAKVLANKLNVPVIIVKGMGDMNYALMEYLSSFNFDCVYFFDEFEKNFKDDDPSVLQIMDGVYNSEYRKVFLLTTNRTWVNENLLSRPSRIRYIKQFKNISRELIDEYMEDNLIDKTAKEDVMTYIDTLEVSTIDILKSTVQEINIHGKESFRKNKGNMNATPRSLLYNCYMFPAGQTWKLSVKDFLCIVKEYEKSVGNNETKDSDFPTFASFAEEFSSILPGTGHTMSEKYTDDTFSSLARELRSNWKVSSDILFKNLRVGDTWYSEEVVYVDHENCVVVTKDNSCAINYYLVKNPNEKRMNYSEGNYDQYSYLY